MFEQRTVPTTAKLAGVLLLAGMAANGILTSSHSGGSTTGDASLRFLPALIWVAAFVLAIVAIVQFRGRGRLWPAYTTLVVVTLGILAAIAGAQLDRGSTSNSNLARVNADATRAGEELTVRNAPLAQVAAACGAAHPEGCTARDIVTSPGAAELGIRLDTGCRVAFDICVSDVPSGGMQVEQVSRPVRDIGLMRVTTSADAGGRPVNRCDAVDPSVPAELERAACGSAAS